jgi:hypothetical protein
MIPEVRRAAEGHPIEKVAKSDAVIVRGLFKGLSGGKQQQQKVKPELVPLQLCEVGEKKKRRTADGALMEMELGRLFASSRTDSDVRSQPAVKPERFKRPPAAQSADRPAAVVRESQECAYCRQAVGQMRRIGCGHFACVECFEFHEALGAVVCPTCKRQ